MNQKQYTGWANLQTIQSKEILSELIDAKEHRRAKLLIAETGNGKSHTIKLFAAAKPKNTFVVVVGDSFKLVDVADAILEMMGLRTKETRIREKLAVITAHMKQLASDKGNPVIIIDEAENLKPVSLRMMKELYDAIIDYSGMVLIGTEQILDTIFNKRKRNRTGVPQLWRRFKAGTRDVTPLNKARDFKPFYDRYIPGDLDLQDLLTSLCENYGELHDYLDPFLWFCKSQDKPINEQTFRLFHKIPKGATIRRIA
jgi:DNA transposition AAA+ family ATPase